MTGLIFIFINIFLPSYHNAKSTTVSISLNELYDNDRFDKILDKRINDVVYSKRIFVSQTVYQLKSLLKLPTQFIYNVIILLAIVTLIFYLHKISLLLEMGSHFSNSLSFFWVYYPFLFCGCTFMAGFDDIPQWAFAAASVYYFFTKKHLASVGFFLLSLLCRETSIFLLAFFFFPYKITYLKRHHFFYIIAFFAFIGLISLFGNNQQALHFLTEKRIYAFMENFYPVEAFVRTVVSLINVFGIPVLCFLLLNKKVKNSDYVKSLMVFTLVNTIFSLLFSLVDESRIIGFPMVLFIPFIGTVLAKVKWASFKFDISFLATIVFSMLFSFFIYEAFESKSGFIYQTYTFINIIIIYLLFIHYRNTKPEAITS